MLGRVSGKLKIHNLILFLVGTTISAPAPANWTSYDTLNHEITVVFDAVADALTYELQYIDPVSILPAWLILIGWHYFWASLCDGSLCECRNFLRWPFRWPRYGHLSPGADFDP